MVLECILSIFVLIFDCNMLPTKSFLSSKHHKIEVMNVVQKFILQMIFLFLKNQSVKTWIMVTANLVYSIVRSTYFFSTLPIYRWSARLCQGALIMIIFSVNLACFTHRAISDLDEEKSPNFLLMIWILSSLLAVWIALN